MQLVGLVLAMVIGAALGAHPRQIVQAIFARAIRQIGVGLAVGVAAAAALDLTTGGELMAGMGTVLPAIAALMLVVGVLAVLGPARGGLRIEPSEALKADA